MNKDIFFIAIIFILVAAGAFFIFFGKGGDSSNSSFVLLNDIKETTGIGFSSIEKRSFAYKFEEGDPLTVAGMEYSASGMSNDQYDALRAYFEDNGFNIDYFEPGSDLSGITYYGKGGEYCVLTVAVGEGEPVRMSAELACGEKSAK